MIGLIFGTVVALEVYISSGCCAPDLTVDSFPLGGAVCAILISTSAILARDARGQRQRGGGAALNWLDTSGGAQDHGPLASILMVIACTR